MSDITEVFKRRFERAFEKSSFTSKRQLALAAKCSEPVVHQIIKGKFDGSNSGPGIFTFHRLAKALNASIDSFLDTDMSPTKRDVSAFNTPLERDPACFDEMMSLHWKGGGRLEKFAHVEDFFDLWSPPTSDSHTPQIYQLGQHSLFSMRLETTDTTVAQRELNSLPLQVKRSVLDFHNSVMSTGIVCDNTFLDHKLKHMPLHVRAGYSRLGLKVENAAGREFVLICCKPIPV